MRTRWLAAWLLLLAVLPRTAMPRGRQAIVVGSKIFTEGYVLGEVAAQTIEASSPPVPVIRKLGMGSTGILFQSLTHRGDRCLRGLHRHADRSHHQEPAAEVPGGDPGRAR